MLRSSWLGGAIQSACWEDCLLQEATKDTDAAQKRRDANKPVPTAYVWNNVWGWGREDSAYRLANAGFDVVLCNATNLYFDLACEKDPLELGYYWAGFVGMRAPFEFVPFDVFKNASQNSMGQPLVEKTFADRVRLTPAGESHILGIQGELWSENLRSEQNVEYMAFPRLIALAERAWARGGGPVSMMPLPATQNCKSYGIGLRIGWGNASYRSITLPAACNIACRRRVQSFKMGDWRQT